MDACGASPPHVQRHMPGRRLHSARKSPARASVHCREPAPGIPPRLSSRRRAAHPRRCWSTSRLSRRHRRDCVAPRAPELPQDPDHLVGTALNFQAHMCHCHASFIGLVQTTAPQRTPPVNAVADTASLGLALCHCAPERSPITRHPQPRRFTAPSTWSRPPLTISPL